MRWQTIATDWEYYKPKAKRHWEALSDQQLDSVAGRYEQLVACLQESYGLSDEVVKDDIREWCFSFGEEAVREEVLRTPLDNLCEAAPAVTPAAVSPEPTAAQPSQTQPSESGPSLSTAPRARAAARLSVSRPG